MADFVEREKIQEVISDIYKDADSAVEGACIEIWSRVKEIPAADVRPVPEGGIGEMSDGYHTFNGLYYQRMVLFAALVNAYNDKAWKSWKHENGESCFSGGWFIVGIDTPQGSYTYHYEDKYWNWFECKELPVAKHWDGHTEEDVTRLLSLDVRPVVKAAWEQVEVRYEDELIDNPVQAVASMFCPNCQCYHNEVYFYGMPTERVNFCPNCGADMREETTNGN